MLSETTRAGGVHPRSTTTPRGGVAGVWWRSLFYQLRTKPPVSLALHTHTMCIYLRLDHAGDAQRRRLRARVLVVVRQLRREARSCKWDFNRLLNTQQGISIRYLKMQQGFQKVCELSFGGNINANAICVKATTGTACLVLSIQKGISIPVHKRSRGFKRLLEIQQGYEQGPKHSKRISIPSLKNAKGFLKMHRRREAHPPGGSAR